MKELFYLKSRSNLYEAIAEYDGTKLIVKKGSRINNTPSEKFKASKKLMNKRADSSLVDKEGNLITNVEFTSFSTAATFVAGHVANGLLSWKTKDKKTAKDYFDELK